MANDNQPFEDLSEPAAQAGEQNTKKARNDLTEKMKTYAEKNISAYAEFVGKLGQAKNFQEVFLIQTEFMQTQLNSLTAQARSITDATKPFRISP